MSGQDPLEQSALPAQPEREQSQEQPTVQPADRESIEAVEDDLTVEALLADIPLSLPQPPYPIPFPHTLSLYSGPATFNGQVLQGGTTVQLTSDARNTILATFELPLNSAHALSDAGQSIPFQPTGFERVSAFIESFTFSQTPGQPALASVNARLTRLTQPAVTTTALDFVGFNLPEWIGTAIREGTSLSYARLVFNAEDFEIILEHHPDRPKKEQLKQTGHGLTTIGRLQRKDGTAFRTDDSAVTLALQALTWTSIFAAANWVNVPALLTATSIEGQPWQTTSLKKRVKFNNPEGWFHPQYVEAVLEVYQGVLSKLQDPLWARPIQEAINWYADAQSEGGTAVGHLIWVQTGLELLGWMQLTQGINPSQTETAFNKAVAAQKIRDLMTVFQIDPALPSTFTDLQTFAENLKASGSVQQDDPLDGPSILTHVRNSFVHPRQRGKHSQMSEHTQGQAKRLALEYLELCLLGILGVTSPVWRRSLGGPATPPWIPTPLH